MGKRQNNLARILNKGGINVFHPSVPDRSLFSQSDLNGELSRVYKTLGGILPEYPLNFGSFDIVLQNCFIELDEENHFHRYRKKTLESRFYSGYAYFSVQDFKDFCDTYEKKARKDGAFWSNGSSQDQFGKSSLKGDFSGNGPARWKQRAFYDMLKDVYGVLINKPVIRISVYSLIGNSNVDRVLKKSNSEDLLFQYIKEEFLSRV